LFPHKRYASKAIQAIQDMRATPTTTAPNRRMLILLSVIGATQARA
jgi:hypothetical protein